MTKMLEEQWHEFHEAMIPPEATELQRNTMKITYYAGALGYQTALMSDHNSPLTTIDHLNEELISFAKQECMERGCGCCQRPEE